jgi:hypothetical protein
MDGETAYGLCRVRALRSASLTHKSYHETFDLNDISSVSHVADSGETAHARGEDCNCGNLWTSFRFHSRYRRCRSVFMVDGNRLQ